MRKRMNVTLTQDFNVPDSDIVFEAGDAITIEYDDGDTALPANPPADLPQAENGADAVNAEADSDEDSGEEAFDVVDDGKKDDDDKDKDEDKDKEEKKSDEDNDVYSAVRTNTRHAFRPVVNNSVFTRIGRFDR